MRLYFVRHGESEANLLQEISNRGWKHGLTDQGRRQAAELAERLRLVQPAHIFTSPLMRAVQTAEILSQALDVPYTTTDALREYDCGIVEGRADPQAWELYRQAVDEWFNQGHWDFSIPSGESLTDMRCRFEPFIAALPSTVGASQPDLPDNGKPVRSPFNPTDSLVLISHGGLLHSCLPFVLTNVTYRQAAEWPLANTAWVLVETRPEGLVCLEWGRNVTTNITNLHE